MAEAPEVPESTLPAPLPIHLPAPRQGAGEVAEERSGGMLSSLTTFAVVAFSICLAKLYIDQYIEIRALTLRSVAAQESLQETRRRHEQLVEEVEYLETLEGVERLARDKLRYIRPDEVILVPLPR